MVLDKAISKLIVPGPMMMFRPASPNGPDGVVKAAVLNHWLMLGLLTVMDWPGTMSGRAAPVTPRCKSEAVPKMRGENGMPEAIVRLPLTENPPNTFCAQPSLVSHFFSLPKGSSYR